MNEISYVELSKSVYEAIKNMILSGELQPGQKILQEKLAKQLGISRTPLLKALHMLEFELMVESRPRKGIYVKELTIEEMIDIFYAREVIEGLAARLAAKRINEQQLNQLRQLFMPFKNNEKDIDSKAYELADRQFHPMLLKYSQSAVLQRLEMTGNILLFAYQAHLVRPPAETISEHLNIIKALEERNSDLAEKTIKEHIKKSREMLENRLNIKN